MKFEFKIYNIDIIDCSSCYNTIFPDPESQEILLRLLLKIFESDVIFRIGQFKFWLDEIELQSPNVYGTDYEDWKTDKSRYHLQTGKEVEVNKLLGLYVEREEDGRDRIKNQKYFERENTKKAFYIEPGLEGIRKGINYIKALFANQREDLPSYLKDINLKNFRFENSVIWGMDADRNKSSYDIDYERDGIAAGCYPSGCYLSFSNSGGDSYEIFELEKYLNHLNSITEILDRIIPGKYEAGPLDYYGLLKWGILKREGRKLVPTDIDDFYEATINFENEKDKKEVQKKRIQEFISVQKSLSIQNLAQVLTISSKDAENIIYELAAEGIDGVLEEGVFKFTSTPEEVINKLFELINKM